MATSAIGTSSIDVNGIVSQLMTLERRPLQVLAQREVTVTARIAAVARVQGAVTSLQTAAAALAGAGTWNGVRASVSGEGAAAAVTDATKAAPGRYTLRVTQLATSQALASGQFDASSEVLGNGTMTLQVGSLTRTITVDASNNTLAGIRDAINAAQAGVTASVVNDGSKFRLTLVANDTGAANTIRLTVLEQGTVAGDAANGDSTGLSRLAFDGSIEIVPPATTAPGRNLVQTRAAADAAFEINGLALTSSGNRISGAIEGVSLDLRRASDTAISEITVERDRAGMRSAVENFIKAYNDLDRTIRDVTSFDPTTRRGAVLNGDGAMRTLHDQLRAVLRSTMSAANSGDFTRLSEVGLEVGRDGSLSLNATRFEAALADTARLERLFRATHESDDSARGFGVRLENLAKAVVGTEGLLPARARGLRSQIDSINKQEDQINQRMVLIEARLRKQYTALDAQLARMQSTSSSLANALNQLPGANSGR
jgi:flagellar hook-associated protein 2